MTPRHSDNRLNIWIERNIDGTNTFEEIRRDAGTIYLKDSNRNLNIELNLRRNQVILDGKLVLDIRNLNEIYKFLQLSKTLRPEIKNLEFNFNYNFDKKVITFDTIKINNEISKKVNATIKTMSLKNNKLQNKIYFKSIMRDAIAAYVG